jgi:hypothetical protein
MLMDFDGFFIPKIAAVICHQRLRRIEANRNHKFLPNLRAPYPKIILSSQKNNIYVVGHKKPSKLYHKSRKSNKVTRGRGKP